MRKNRTKWNTREHNRALVWFFACFAAVFFVLNTTAADTAYSDDENRPLAQKPEATKENLADGTYFDDYESYYSDQFFERSGWMRLQFRLSYLAGKREFDGVFIGKDGYLLSDPAEPEAGAYEETAKAINRFAADYPDVQMSAMIVPGAAAVMQDKLPLGAPVRDQIADIRSLEEMLGDAVQTVDVSTALQEHADEEIYYRTDHHWTSLGAYYGFAEYAKGRDIPVTGTSFQEMKVSDSFEGTLASRSGDHSSRDEISIYVPTDEEVMYDVSIPDEQILSRSCYDSAKLEEKDQYQVFMGGNHAIAEIRTKAANNRHLLILKDSYANCFVQFLVPYYESITVIDPRYYYSDLRAVMNSSGINEVLFLYSADTLAEHTPLADVLAHGE